MYHILFKNVGMNDVSLVDTYTDSHLVLNTPRGGPFIGPGRTFPGTLSVQSMDILNSFPNLPGNVKVGGLYALGISARWSQQNEPTDLHRT